MDLATQGSLHCGWGAETIPPWRAVIEALPHVVWVSAADGRTLFVNHRGFEVAGLDLELASEMRWLQIVHPEDAQRAEIDWLYAIRFAESGQGEYRLRATDGTYRWMRVRYVPIPGADGGVEGWVGTWSDIDDIKRWQVELAEANRRSAEALAALEALQSAAPVGIGLVDRDYRIVQLNETMARLNGVDPSEAIGARLDELLADRWLFVRDHYATVFSTGEPILNLDVHRPTARGEPSDWVVNYYPVRVGEELIGVGVVALDITERKLDEEFRTAVMENMAEGLYALDENGRATYVNAAAGRMLGWQPGELLGRDMHETVHYRRLDGTLLPAEECSLLQVRDRGEAIRRRNDAFTRKDGTTFPAAYSSAPLLSGRTVRGAVVVFHDLTEENTERSRRQRELAALTWVGRIKDALDEGRMVLHSQPIVPAHGAQPGEELLIRMVDRDGGVIPPGAFLPVAERYGLIGDIDKWVIAKGMRLARHGRKVEINLSGASVADPEIIETIDRELRHSGADPANVVFELTETALITDMTAGEDFAIRIAEMGCQLALDDFGTGYGSFTYLKRLPINLLKIDTEFVQDVLSSAANRHVVRAIINLAQAFGLRTVAEGIEDAETWDYLRDEGVDFGQGYHLGRPTAVDVSLLT